MSFKNREQNLLVVILKHEMPQRGMIGVASHSYGWRNLGPPCNACL